MSDPSIATLDAKINSFIDSQDKHNDKVTNAIDKMSETISTINTVHVEINHLSEKTTRTDNTIESIVKDLKVINDKVISNSIQADEYKYIKRIFISFIIVSMLGGGYMTKTAIDNSARQAASMAEIVKAIKSNQLN